MTARATASATARERRLLGAGPALLLLTALVCSCAVAQPGSRSDPATEETEPRDTAPGTSVRVVDVVDGDTLRVATADGRDLGRVRLLGLNAPEVAHDGGPSECYASQATDLLASLAPAGSTITIRPDPGQPDRDRYDRLLRYVDIKVDVGSGGSASQDSSGPNAGDVDATERLLALGAAELYRNDPVLQRGEEYAAAFTAARNRGAGQWTACAA